MKKTETTPIGAIKRLNINGVEIDSIKITDNEWIVPYAFEKCNCVPQRSPHIFITEHAYVEQ